MSSSVRSSLTRRKMLYLWQAAGFQTKPIVPTACTVWLVLGSRKMLGHRVEEAHQHH